LEKTKTWLASGFAFLTVALVAMILASWSGMVLMIAMSGLALLIGWYVTRVLGGLTGDVYGATNEIIEVMGLIFLVALIPFGLFEQFKIVIW